MSFQQSILFAYENSLNHFLNIGYYIGTGVVSICLIGVIYSRGFGPQYS